MVKQYQRKRTKEELISGFKQAIAKKKEWLEAHHKKILKKLSSFLLMHKDKQKGEDSFTCM